ncbi:MAG: type IV pilus assembly protein PilM [Bdellovibrionota bacterium]
MVFKGFFQRRESLISLDIGARSVKCMQVKRDGTRVQVQKVSSTRLSESPFTNQMVTNSHLLAEAIERVIVQDMLRDSEEEYPRVVLSVPGPAVFTKKLKMAQLPYRELVENVRREAANFIPHNIEAVKLDFHILGEVGKHQYEILVVAVKSEVVEALRTTLSSIGLKPAIIDADYFALQNIFEYSYPELRSSTIALVDLGARYSIVNIVNLGKSLFVGDISTGTETIADTLEEVHKITISRGDNWLEDSEQMAPIEHAVRSEAMKLAREFNRQLSFFWSAAGAEQRIEKIVLSGEAAVLPGFVEALEEITEIPCQPIEPFRKIDIHSGLKREELERMGPQLSIACGLSLRELGDRIMPGSL